jgi:predicted aspartyl protease
MFKRVLHLFRYRIAAITCAIIALVAFSVKSSPSLADDDITQLNTSSGLLVIRKVLGSDCGFGDECTALYLNDKLLLADHYVSITKTFPSNTNPQLVSIATSTGGNACCSTDYIFDFTKKPPLKLQDIGFGSEISRTATGVEFQYRAGEDALGDWLIGTYSYKLGSGRVVKVGVKPEYTTTPLNAKAYPWDILTDPVMREPLLKIIGKDYFSKFRVSMSAADSCKIIDGNFIVGSGCQAHSCSDRRAMFVIDVINKLAWAIEKVDELDQKPTTRFWGVLTPEDAVPMREIRRWLADENVPEGMVSVVPLPESVSKLYKQRRQAVARTEVLPPPLSSAKRDVPAKPPLSEIQSSQHATIPLQEEGGAFVVPVSINGELTLNFMIDSGAADVSIPADVVMTLVRTGTLTAQDFLGTQTYRLADGSAVPSRTFRVRSLKVGDRVLYNIVGSVAPVAGGLLLGQSFLSRFKTWSIDNDRHVLVLE